MPQGTKAGEQPAPPGTLGRPAGKAHARKIAVRKTRREATVPRSIAADLVVDTTVGAIPGFLPVGDLVALLAIGAMFGAILTRLVACDPVVDLFLLAIALVDLTVLLALLRLLLAVLVAIALLCA